MIGRIIHDRILTHPCSPRAIPSNRGEPVALENTLVGWVLHVGRERVECASKGEARYLAIFAKMGYTEAPVPDDPSVLESILTDLEADWADLKRRIDEGTSSELNPTRRREIEELVWEGIREKLAIEKHPPVASV